jgi:hypothetical protein
VWTQILLPILVAALIFIAVIFIMSFATFRANGDVNRWAAISIIWLILPVMIASLIFLILLVGLIYLVGRFTDLLPPYSYQAQRIVYRFEAAVKHYALMFRKPVLVLQELTKILRVYIEGLGKANSGKT